MTKDQRMNLTPEHYGMLKGIVGASLLFLTVIVVDLSLLHQNTKKKWTSCSETQHGIA